MEVLEMIALFTIGLVFGVCIAKTLIWYGSRYPDYGKNHPYLKDREEYL